MQERKTAPELDPDILERVFTVTAMTEHVDKLKHRAEVHANHGFDTVHTFFSDEPEAMEGDDEYAYPLYYLTAGIGL